MTNQLVISFAVGGFFGFIIGAGVMIISLKDMLKDD